MDLGKFNEMYDSIRHGMKEGYKEGYKEGGQARKKYASGSGSPPTTNLTTNLTNNSTNLGISSLGPQTYTPNLYHASAVGNVTSQGFGSTTTTNPSQTNIALSQGLPLYFNQSVSGGAIDPLSYLTQGNNLLSATPEQIVQQNNQRQQQQMQQAMAAQQAATQQGASQQGASQQTPTWFGADGGHVKTHLTTTTPPKHGPNPYGVASMFKQRYT